jgi:hypothetical protein
MPEAAAEATALALGTALSTAAGLSLTTAVAVGSPELASWAAGAGS